MAKRKGKYTSAQKKAYYSGMGYHAGYKRKAIPFKSQKNKASFQAGYKRAGNTVKKYPSLGR